ncbi:two-component system NtrC family response regulator [Desulfohalotomaculum tongense]|uniref:sigma 54-interacting transcriptional regulator n=1 Tax=Desulforadius tongensis TaxID=1216062 RepID=UPI00195E8792|nr:two-component system NtrC family response regulator [Desulforadius tongensis]
MIPKILIIDDEEHMCWALKRAMEQEGYQAITATSGNKGISLLKNKGPSLVLLDLKMPGMDGMEVLKVIKEIHPKIPVIMITAHGTIETAIEAMKLGANDYITKPFDLDELKMVVKQALKYSELVSEVSFLRSELSKKYGTIIGESPAIKEVILLIERVAATNATVMITGESGTGKEVTALAIHQASDRRDYPFVPVNCAALPEQLLESELFGHEKGAFTGAVALKRGRFELADKGTIFLDEIAEMSPAMQAKLLRVLQERSFERVGGTETLHVNVRIIAATNRDIRELIRKGEFREDLYYRLNVIHIHLPPLRERRDDIPLLANNFLRKYMMGTYPVKDIDPEAMELLVNYDWPGNIRELQNVIERAVIICRGNKILPEHLPIELQQKADNNQFAVETIVNFPDSGISLEQVEKELILKALEKSKGNQTKAAQLLGITRSALIYRSQKYNIKLG